MVAITRYLSIFTLVIFCIPLSAKADSYCFQNSTSTDEGTGLQPVVNFKQDPEAVVNRVGVYINNTEVCDFNSITADLRTSNAGTSTDEVLLVAEIYKVSTSTDDLDELLYRSAEVLVDLQDNDTFTVTFPFPSTYTTVPARQYVIVISPVEQWTISDGVIDQVFWEITNDFTRDDILGLLYTSDTFIGGYAGYQGWDTVHTWNYDSVGYNSSQQPQFDLWYDADLDFLSITDDYYIDITDPCNSTTAQNLNITNTPLCFTNTTSDTVGGNVRWSASSTSETAQVRVFLRDIETQEIIDSFTSAYVVSGDRLWSGTMTYGSSTLMELTACVEPGDSFTLFADPEWIKCVKLYICNNGISEATCYESLRENGEPVSYTQEDQSWWKQQVDYLFGQVKKSFPFYYGFAIYEAYMYYRTIPTDFTVSFDVSAFDSDTGLDPEIPINPDTSEWNISAMARYAETLSPGLFTAIDTILWGLFGLFIVFRIFSGTWHHGLEAGVTEIKARELENRALAYKNQREARLNALRSYKNR